MARSSRLAIWFACSAPLSWLTILIWRELQAPGSLGADPGEAVVHHLGEWSIRMLLVTLTLSSLARMFRWPLIRVRRMVGLWAFTYVSLHLLGYVGLLAIFDVTRIVEDLGERPYIIAGFTGFLLLVPLAITSTKGWRARLGRDWTHLHRLVYAAAALAVVHVWWLSKSSYFDASLYGAWLALLLLERMRWPRSVFTTETAQRTPI